MSEHCHWAFMGAHECTLEHQRACSVCGVRMCGGRFSFVLFSGPRAFYACDACKDDVKAGLATAKMLGGGVS